MKKNINEFFILKIQNIILTVIRILVFRQSRETKDNIAIFRPGNLGDLVCAIPSFYSIRKKFPESKITLITSKGTGSWGGEELFHDSYLFDEIINYNVNQLDKVSKKIEFIKILRSKKFDLWIDYGNQVNTFKHFLRQIFIVKICKAKFLWLGKVICFPYFANYQNKNFKFMNETTRLNKFIESYGVNSIQIKKELMHDNYYSNSILNKISNYAVISTGSAQPYLNFWDEKKFAEVLKYIDLNHKILFIGTESEKEIVDRLSYNLINEPINLIGKTSIKNLFSILYNARFVFGLDSGIQHVAAFEGTNVITLTSCWNFDNTWTPEGEGTIITLKNNDSSSKCLFNRNREGNKSCYKKWGCINQITVDEAINAIKQFK